MRNPRTNCFVGSRGAGKSTYIADSVKMATGNVIVLKFWPNIDDPAMDFLPIKTIQNLRQGLKPGQPVKCRIGLGKKDYKSTIQWALDYYRNGILIIDDCTIFEKDNLSELLEDLITVNRHLGMDVWLVFHGFTGLPIDLYKFINYLVIFNTNDNPDYKKNKIPKYDEVAKASEEMKKRFESLKTNDPKRYKPNVVMLSQ